MKIMKDTTAMAYELREFLACQTSRSQLTHVDNALFAGEPVDSIITGFALAYDLKLFVPQHVRDEYLSGIAWSEDERDELREYFAAIPLDHAA